MQEKIIRVERQASVDQQMLSQLLGLVPPRHRQDERLARFLAFRLKVDGFETTKKYLTGKVMEAERCTFRGLLYDFLKDDEASRTCQEK